MKRRSIVGAAIAVVASIVLAGSALAAFAGVTNGSFENGNYVDNGSGFQTLSAGNTNLTDWAITGSVDWIGSYWQAQAGSKILDMDGNAQGAISQTLTTTIGNTYFVSFYLSGNPEGAPAVKTLTVSATGASLATYIFDTTGHSKSNMGWTAKGYSFRATSASTVLTFASATAGVSGPALDNIVVTETVAPGATCKKGGWKTMHDRLGNGFKNQGDCVSYYATGLKNLGSVTP